MKPIAEMTGPELAAEMRSARGVMQRRQAAVIRARQDEREAYERVLAVQAVRRARKAGAGS
jgi:hypothetical protein